MPINRLNQLEETLDLLREQLAGLEKTQALSPMEEKVRLGQRIKELKKEIQTVEAEYWQTVANSANQLEISEPEAEIAVGEIVEAVTQLETRPVSPYPDKVVQILRQILDKLNEPSPSASAKLKGTLSLIPPFFSPSIEAELNTEAFFRTHFPTFTRVIRGAAKK